jgi:hypothetical protein
MTDTAHTPLPWEWWNGCSWWRIGTSDQGKPPVLEPTIDSDGHPNLICRKEDRDFIVLAVNNHDRLQRENEELREYVQHDSNCILSFWEVGEPTEGGGYRMKFKGKWYTEKPKCNCGLDEVLKSSPRG